MRNTRKLKQICSFSRVSHISRFSILVFGFSIHLAYGAPPLPLDSRIDKSGAPKGTVASAPSSQPGKVVKLGPGIQIDWKRREVVADATVIMREGLVELFACAPRQREHESIVRLEARPLDLYHALGLIGLSPGHPIRMNETTQKVESAVGAPVEIDVRFERDGQTVQEPIESWLRRAKSKEKIGRLAWIFTGSVKTEDGFAADFEGTIIALVDFSSSLVTLPEGHSSNNDELWLEPATPFIPAVGTRCTLVFRAGPIRIALDAVGRLTMDGQRVSRADLAKRLLTAAKENPELHVILSVDESCPSAERESVEKMIHLAGVREKNLATSRPSAEAWPAPDPEVFTTLLRAVLQPSSAPESQSGFAESSHELVSDLRTRGLALRERTENVADYLACVSKQMRSLFGGSAPERSSIQGPKK